jgi:hypothetical protein
LAERLIDIPSSDEETDWFGPDGQRMNEEIAPHECHTDDVLKVIQRHDGRYVAHMTFRHDTIIRNDVQIRSAEREARAWVEQVWGIPKNALQTKMNLGEDGTLHVRVAEQFLSTEQYDDTPAVYIWLRGGDNRRR